MKRLHPLHNGINTCNKIRYSYYREHSYNIDTWRYIDGVQNLKLRILRIASKFEVITTF